MMMKMMILMMRMINKEIIESKAGIHLSVYFKSDFMVLIVYIPERKKISKNKTYKSAE